MMTATIIPQIPKIPAMTTGTTDFMISSGLRTPMEQMPTPAFADPQAAPRLAKTRAEATPMYPKKYCAPYPLLMLTEICNITNNREFQLISVYSSLPLSKSASFTTLVSLQKFDWSDSLNQFQKIITQVFQCYTKVETCQLHESIQFIFIGTDQTSRAINNIASSKETMKIVPAFKVELLLNTPLSKQLQDYKTSNTQQFSPQKYKTSSKTKASTDSNCPSPLPSLNKIFNTKEEYLKFTDKCGQYVGRKKVSCKTSKGEDLNTMFNNIKQTLKKNEMSERKSRQKVKTGDLQKEGALVAKSRRYEETYQSEDKMQFYRLNRITNQGSHQLIKNALNNKQRQIINPFMINKTMQLHSLVLIESKKRPAKSQIKDQLAIKNHASINRSDTSRLAISLSKSMSFNLKQQSDHTYPRKIKSYLEFLFKINYSNSIYVDLSLAKPQEQITKYKVYIGRGNNCKLVESLVKRRFWWQITKNINDKDIQFYWSQNTIERVQRSQIRSQAGSGKTTRTRTSSVKIKRNQQKEELNRKILSQKQAESVERYILTEGLRIPNLETFSPDILTNHLPNNHCIGSKKNLFKSLHHYHSNITGKDPFLYIPKTYHVKSMLDPEFTLFTQQNGQDPDKLWIIKPGEHTNRGKSIQIVPFKQISTLLSSSHQKHDNGSEMTFIIQNYMTKPLLYNGRKFDIRHFMLLTSVNGIVKAYWYRDGYLRTSSYLFDPQDTSNLYIHLTNDAIQKTSDQYQKYEAANKVSYTEFQRYLDGTWPQKRYKFEVTLEKMKQIAIEMVKANYLVLDQQRMKNNFEIIGLDFMLDRELKPWLIEANYNPCLQVNCIVLERIIPAMLQNSLRVCVDPLFPPTCHYPHNQRFYLSDNYLHHLKYQLIFDQRALAEPILNPYNFQDSKCEQEQYLDEGKEIEEVII